jgi:probable HAF family extracellular repeat protein
MTRFVQTVAVALSLLWSGGVVAAATYTFTTLRVPGATDTQPFGVNDQGHVVGIYNGGSNPRGFYWDGSTFTTITVAGCVRADAQGINNQDEFVGFCENASGVHGFYADLHGFQQLLDMPGARQTYLMAVTTEGSFAGTIYDASNTQHGVFIDGDTWTVIDAPGADQTQEIVWGLNASNVMSGQYFNAASTEAHGFLTADGVNFTTLDYPGAVGQTYGGGISDAGQVVGYFRATGPQGFINHGFLWDGTTYSQIDVPGAAETAVRGISPDGSKLVGTWSDGVATYGFLATAQSDRTPPAITIMASPAELWPPNGKLIPVTVSGTILDSGVGVDPSAATFAVLDEYGVVHPTGPLTLQPNGAYSFTVSLQASRRGSDADGRHYTITVSAKDLAGNPRVSTAVVVVPHG